MLQTTPCAPRNFYVATFALRCWGRLIPRSHLCASGSYTTHFTTRPDSTRLAAPAVGMAESSPNTSPGTTALDEFVNSISVGENLYPQDIDSSVDADIDKVRWHKVNPQNQCPVTTNHSLLFRTIFRFYAILRMLGHFS